MAVASLGDINLDGAASGDSSIGYHGMQILDIQMSFMWIQNMERIGGYRGEIQADTSYDRWIPWQTLSG